MLLGDGLWRTDDVVFVLIDEPYLIFSLYPLFHSVDRDDLVLTFIYFWLGSIYYTLWLGSVDTWVNFGLSLEAM